MTRSGTTRMLHELRRVMLRVDGGVMTDGQLLEAFLAQQEAAAFESLVGRHGPMVYGMAIRPSSGISEVFPRRCWSSRTLRSAEDG